MNQSTEPRNPQPEPLTPTRETDIRARMAAATPGPWCTDSWEIYCGVEYEAGAEWIGETCRGVSDRAGLAQDRANAAFVAGARTDVPVLLAEVTRLRAEREALREQLSLARTAVAYWKGQYHQASNTRWCDEIPPGGEVCATCGTPVESEPCPEHSPQARSTTQQGEAQWAAKTAVTTPAGDLLHPDPNTLPTLDYDDGLSGYNTGPVRTAEDTAARDALGGGEQRG